MSNILTKNGYSHDGPLLIIVIDGLGEAPPGKGNAVEQANPPFYKKLIQEAKSKHLHTLLKAHGPSVGLPSDGDMGNSEVGHNALGCGQIYSQGAKLVNESLESGSFFRTSVWSQTITKAAQTHNAVHFFGLLSDGNVHSHINQLFTILHNTARCGVERIFVHVLLDGRDVSPSSGLNYVDLLENELEKIRKQYKIEARIASGGGRMCVTMDRYESDWKIIQRGWETMVYGRISEEITPEISEEYSGYFRTAREAIECARKVFPKKLDQYNPPFVIVSEEEEKREGEKTKEKPKLVPIGRMKDGDVVINFNFRGDRALQISKAFTAPKDDKETAKEIQSKSKSNPFPYFNRGDFPTLHYAGLLEYDAELHIPPTFLVPPPAISNVSGEYICAQKIKSYAIAETHKFGHMTYFWNGNRTGFINEEFETYEEVRSLPNEQTESHPEMKAREVTEKLISALSSKRFKYLRVNYANPDMVGHTGNIESVVSAMLKLDEELKRVVEKVEEMGGIVLLTADHGNAEQMYDSNDVLMTSHTVNPVHFLIHDTKYKGEYVVDTSEIKIPGLANVAATILALLGYEAPPMYEKPLIRFTK